MGRESQKQQNILKILGHYLQKSPPTHQERKKIHSKLEVHQAKMEENPIIETNVQIESTLRDELNKSCRKEERIFETQFQKPLVEIGG